MTVIERLKAYMTHKGLNPNKVTIDAGLSNGLIGRAIKGNSGLNSDTIEKILYTYNDLNPEWFLMEVGEMIKTNHQSITNNGNGNNLNSNINGNVSGDVTISQNEYSHMVESQKKNEKMQEEFNERLKTSQEQLSESIKQISKLLEILNK